MLPWWDVCSAAEGWLPLEGNEGAKLALAQPHTVLLGSFQQTALVTWVWPAHGSGWQGCVRPCTADLKCVCLLAGQ